MVCKGQIILSLIEKSLNTLREVSVKFRVPHLSLPEFIRSAYSQGLVDVINKALGITGRLLVPSTDGCCVLIWEK